MEKPLAAITFRQATSADASFLGLLNRQLIEDEGHRNTMSVEQLVVRMGNWLAGEYQAAIFERGGVVAYALYREEDAQVFLRQFFVERGLRRAGVGRECIRLLFERIWPAKRVTVDVLATNRAGTDFWRSVGFGDYCLTLEASPRRVSEGDEPAG